jgi:hypothetical protein
MGLRILRCIRQAAIDANVNQLVASWTLAGQQLSETKGLEMAMQLRVADVKEGTPSPAVAVLIVDEDGDTASR